MKFVADARCEQVLIATLVHIQAHLDEELSLSGLAARAGLSAFHFHRLFSQFVGEPLQAHVRRLRLERAAMRLKISAERMLDIALEAGFQSHEAFTRAFVRRFGLPPTAFRENFIAAARERALQPPQSNAWADPRGPAPGEASVRRVRTRPLLVAFVRHVGAYERVLEEGATLASLWQELFAWGRATGLIGADPLLLGIPQDDPSVTAPERQRFDIGVQVPAFHSPTGSIGCQTLQPGLHAVARHHGPFETLAQTYARIHDVEIASGRSRMRLAPPFEVYGHTQVNEQLCIHHTDVFLPIEALAGNHRSKPGDRA